MEGVLGLGLVQFVLILLVLILLALILLKIKESVIGIIHFLSFLFWLWTIWCTIKLLCFNFISSVCLFWNNERYIFFNILDINFILFGITWLNLILILCWLKYNFIIVFLLVYIHIDSLSLMDWNFLGKHFSVWLVLSFEFFQLFFHDHHLLQKDTQNLINPVLTHGLLFQKALIFKFLKNINFQRNWNWIQGQSANMLIFSSKFCIYFQAHRILIRL